jgi:hypothetical protein
MNAEDTNFVHYVKNTVTDFPDLRVSSEAVNRLISIIEALDHELGRIKGTISTTGYLCEKRGN